MKRTRATEQRRNAFRLVRILLNPFAKLMLRSPFHGIMSGRLLLITFTGRTSGKKFTTPISYVQQGDTLLLGVGGPWWKNLRNGPTVCVQLRGKRRTGVAEVVTDEEGMSESYRIMLAHNPVQARFMGITADPNGQPNADDLRQAIERGAAVVRVHIKAQPGVRAGAVASGRR
jgi:deazaflavin-dependent oxidoreductase (nitroreductase family)